MSKKILITSALPYANGPLHFGHIAGAYLPGDCYARFQRLLKNDVLYICGSDEYGIAITMSAEIAGRTPKEHVDIFHEVNKKFFQQLNISFDHYSRTTCPAHRAPVQQYFLDLLNNGYIEEKVTDQLYSEKDQKFLADRYVVGQCPRCGFANARGDECTECGASYEATDLKDPRSKLTNSPLVLKPTKHWFLLLDKFKERLTAWIETKNWKPNVCNFVKGYIQELRPRAITRDTNWGIPIPLPGSDGKVLYVWFDAPIGYISASQEWAQQSGDPQRWEKYWFDQETKLVHFIGKDNIPFHAVIFPAMTMGQNQPYKLVDELPANEFYKLEGRQFSKSDGWFIDLDDFFKRYTADQIRFAIAANAPETGDSEFTWKDFQLQCNSGLLAKYGNFVNRVLVFAKNNCNGSVPAKINLEPVDQEFLENIRNFIDLSANHFETFKVRRASHLIMELAQLGNIYFDQKKPWLDAKNTETKDRMQTTISCCMECLRALALVSTPIIPQTADKVWKMLGFKSELTNCGWEEIRDMTIPTGQQIEEPKILFTRIEDEQIEQEIAKLHSLVKNLDLKKPPTQFAPLKPVIDIEHVRQLDLRIAQILAAEAVPKSKKLLLLQVDIGFEIRTIVAGISQFYQPHELIGKKVVVVANLKPATLMGIQSHGMVLAGSIDQHLEVVAVQNLAPGSVVS